MIKPLHLLTSAAFLIAFNTLNAQVPVMNPIQGASVVCSTPGPNYNYTASASNNPTSYTWLVLPSAGVVIFNPSANITGISFPNTNSTYTVYCMATNSSGTSSMVAKPVDVYETPTVTFSGLTNVCQGSPTVLMASPTLISSSSTLTYSWSPSTGLSSTTSYTVIAVPPSTTNYTVLLTLGSCTNTAFRTLNVASCVGIEDANAAPAKSLFIYPNPNKGDFSISSKNTGQAFIFNQMGQKIREFILKEEEETKIQGLTDGIYFLVNSREKIKIVVVN